MGRQIVTGLGPRLHAVARNPTLGEIAFLNLRNHEGYGTVQAMKKAAEACTTIACLAIAAINSDEGFPSQLDYAAYWKLSERTAQREWALFKKAFPGEESPERLARWLMSEYASRLSKRQDASVAFSAEAPATLLTPV